MQQQSEQDGGEQAQPDSSISRMEHSLANAIMLQGLRCTRHRGVRVRMQPIRPTGCPHPVASEQWVGAEETTVGRRCVVKCLLPPLWR